MSVTQAIAIPKLEAGQKISEWRKVYMAATALLTEEQKICLIPVYVNRSTGDNEIAHLCAKKTTIQEALDELETFIDGSPSRVTLFKNFCDIRCDKNDWKSTFFQLQTEGRKAGVGNDLIFIRLLGFLPGGQKFLEANDDVLKPGVSDEDIMKLFGKLQKKLETLLPEKSAIKAEDNSEKDFVFKAEEGKEPAWAAEIRNELSGIKDRLDQEDGFYSDSSDTNASSSGEEAVYYAGKGKYKHVTCYVCSKKGHTASRCFKRVCGRCKGIGHSERECSSQYKGREKRRTSDKKKPL